MAIFEVEQDFIIMGGGIAGLWLHNLLNHAGFSSTVLERNALGFGQTIASQGMLHGGIKYSLNGSLSNATNTIASMPQYWEQCLNGRGDIDLRGCKILSDCYYMWSTESLLLQLTSFLGSKALRGQISRLSAAHRPDVFSSKAFKGQLYKIADRVLDVPSLIKALQKPFNDTLYHLPSATTTTLEFGPSKQFDAHLVVKNKTDQINFKAQYIILSAGLGNEALIEQAGLSHQIATQRRPLQMVMACHHQAQWLYGHCVGTNPVPKLTVTTHPLEDGRNVWYIGGAVAETGVKRTPAQQIEYTQKEFAKLLPWINLDEVQWRTVYVDRAEPKQPGLVRPDASYFTEKNRIIATWPTKLTLTPQLGQNILSYLHSESIVPKYNARPSLPLVPPKIALTPWQEAFL